MGKEENKHCFFDSNVNIKPMDTSICFGNFIKNIQRKTVFYLFKDMVNKKHIYITKVIVFHSLLQLLENKPCDKRLFPFVFHNTFIITLFHFNLLLP